MSTALAVTSSDLVLAGPDRQTPGAHVFAPPREQPLETALAETHALLERHGYLVVVHPSGLPTPFLHRLHTVRALLESHRIALMPVALPPLATAVLVRQLRQLSVCDFSPGVLGAAVRLLTHYLYAGAVLGSVTGLDRVPVGLGAHTRSWLPGSRFAVLAAPVPELVRIGGAGADGEAALTGPQFATRLTVARGPLGGEWATGRLASRWRVAGVDEAPLPGESAAWWGTGKLTEFVAGIPEVSVLRQLVASVRRDLCHWCGLELIGDRCAFCAAPAPPDGGSAGRAAGRGTEGGAGPGPARAAAEPAGGGATAAASPPASASASASASAARQDDGPVVADPRGIRR
ncbi:hypothetical protein [Streptomyces cacaoi]|uniref:Uncharacterized protein n=2 Tax=Streptomyces cacaoi TaxID=1898 RepID=A0A4Y3R949_STRCI|nr:hypothetical protein [Streptomyces cacaoi]GEB54275.1 hypothetical protein SCA03_68260 [Streptomyces cacaoi]